VLLAGLNAEALDKALAGLDLHAYTESTVRDVDELRHALDVVRQRGYAIVDQELEHGLRSAAAPVRDDAGTVLAAVNVSVHASRATIEDIETRFVPPLLEAVERISADYVSLGSRSADRNSYTDSKSVAMP
jgi:IclR family transcriptional regulator, pca regulon regulatory protein